MNSTEKAICIYHGNCADGFGAAYAVWRFFGNTCDYVPATYGQEPPDIKGRDVYMVDFSYKRDVLLEMAAKAKHILILDHHDTAEKELVDLPDNVSVVFDQSKSGAVIAWNYFLPNIKVPRLLLHVQDRDLWQFKINGTREITAALFAREWTFADWRVHESGPALSKLKAEGAALERKQKKDVEALCEEGNVSFAKWYVGDNLLEIPTVNCPWMFASDVGHLLNEKYPDAPFSFTFFCQKDTVKFSLRSKGKIHCGHEAAKLGGGGHPNAAGFVISHAEFRNIIG